MIALNFYKIMPLGSAYQRSQHSVTAILVRQLLPSDGFAWLSSDLAIFTDWLDALRGEDGGGEGRFIHTLELIKLAGVEPYVTGMSGVPNQDGENSPATALMVDQFLSWLQDGLANKSIKVNTADAKCPCDNSGCFC